MKLKIVLPIFLAVLSMTHVANAAKELTFSIEQGGSKSHQSAHVDQGKVYFKSLNGDANQDALYDHDLQTLYVIQHADKSYYKIDEALIQQVSSTLDSLSQLAAQNGLSDLLGKAGLGAASAPEVRQTDKALQVAGIDCQVIRVLVDNNPQSELCVANKASLSVLGEDYATLDGLFAFSEKLASRANKLMSSIGFNVASFARPSVGGLPIAGYSFLDQSQSKLVKITEVDGIELGLPDGYSQLRMPAMSQ